MIGYITLGTNDHDRAKAFYDAVLAELGVIRPQPATILRPRKFK